MSHQIEVEQIINQFQEKIYIVKVKFAVNDERGPAVGWGMSLKNSCKAAAFQVREVANKRIQRMESQIKSDRECQERIQSRFEQRLHKLEKQCEVAENSRDPEQKRELKRLKEKKEFSLKNRELYYCSAKHMEQINKDRIDGWKKRRDAVLDELKGIERE